MARENKNIQQIISSSIFGSIEKSGEMIGSVISNFNASEIYNILANRLGINWFFDKILTVDITKTAKQVEKFKNKYPSDTPEQLVDRLTKHKAFYSATVGFTSGLVPGNIPAIIFDFVATIGAQTELIYEIALIYGMDLEDDTRKGEVLTLIALGAGSTKTAEATLKLAMDISSQKVGHLVAEKMIKAFAIVVGEKVAKKFFSKLIPVIGGLIGASLNASMVTLTGKGAKAFYKNLTSKNLVYSGSLPEELKQIYNKHDLQLEIKTEIKDLLIIKIIVFLLHKGDYSENSIAEVIFKYFPEIKNEPQFEEFILNEIKAPSYSNDLVEQLDKSIASLLITKSIICINYLGSLNEYHKSYLKGIALKFDIPFDVLNISRDNIEEDDSKML